MTNSKMSLMVVGLSITVVVVATLVALNQYRIPPNHENIEVRELETNSGWGYEILVNNQRMIYQTIIPSIEGKAGFRTKEDALKVGQLVAERISSNHYPSVSMEDLEQLNIVIP